MNRIVREHYPASLLPDDLRQEIGEDRTVTITIEVEEEEGQSPADWFARFRHLHRETFKSIDEVNDYVRGLRDEWNDRER